MAEAGQTETLKLSDGTTMDLTKLPDVDEATWNDVKQYLESKPDVAKNLQSFAKNPDAIRGWLQTQVIAAHYQTKIANDDASVQERMKSLKEDPELKPIFEDIEKNGLEAALKHANNEELMLKISRAMGGLPQEVQGSLKALNQQSLTVHEACKNGDTKAVEAHLAKQRPVDEKDFKGITPLGYAIGANQKAVVQLLLDSKANPQAVDSAGNSGLHYAAGYGRKELVELLLKNGASANQSNEQGQTPLKVAMMNKQTETIQVLEQHGAKV
jgi:hypothetical protein